MFIRSLERNIITGGAFAAAPVVDVDFGNVRTNVFHSDRKGRFTGQLPQAVNDNFSGWSDAEVDTQVRSGNGRRCLRFTTRGRTGAGGQFSVQLPQPRQGTAQSLFIAFSS
mgnify:CR=1 FL=1